MKVSCDPEKRRKTLEERGLDFKDLPLVLEGNLLTHEDTRFDYGEKRYISVGVLSQRVVVVVYAWREDVLRVISMRKANEREIKVYRKQFEDE